MSTPTSTEVTRRYVGQRVRRFEDLRILRGGGRFVDDVTLPGMLHAAFVRSPYPHARIVSIDTSKARALAGVAGVYTGADLAAHVAQFTEPNPFPGQRPVVYDVLPRDKVRFVGDPVALVVADSRYLAEDACAAVDMECELLEPVVSTQQATSEGAPLVWDNIPGNLMHEDPSGMYVYGDVDSAFAAADHVVREVFEQHRYGGASIEPRGCVASYDPNTEELTYWGSLTAVHHHRITLAEKLGLPVNRVRAICKDVGGAFGLKWYVFREDTSVATASMLLGRPVKWIEDRQESLLAAGTAREETVVAELALERDGTILGLKVDLTIDNGAYPTQPQLTPVLAHLVRTEIIAALRIDNFAFSSRTVFTNKNSWMAYRGPGAIEALVRERLLDLAARDLGLDPIAIRKRNIITREEQPINMPTGTIRDRVTQMETLDAILERIDLDTFREEQRRAREHGRYIGFGIAADIQPSPGTADSWWTALGFPATHDGARVRLEPDGRVTAYSAQQPHGMSHETSMAQVIADQLGVRYEDVTVVFGDTQSTPFHILGSGASRGAKMGHGAVQTAAFELRKRVLNMAAEELEANPNDLDIVDGTIFVQGSPDKSIALRTLVFEKYMTRSTDAPFEVFLAFDGATGGWMSSTHACWVEVDVATGHVKVLRYIVSEDCGTMIHPAVVEGQFRGGVVQGISGHLYEHFPYDENGYPMVRAFHDYVLPSTMDVPPRVEFVHLETAVADDPVNYVGIGEGGNILAPAALANAVEDALSPFGARITKLPLSPTRVLELIGAI